MPNSPKKLQAGQESTPLVTMWFETTLGVRYEMPDMMEHHVDDAHRNLDQADLSQYVHVRNVSDAIYMIPKRIIQKSGVGDRCFWEKQ